MRRIGAILSSYTQVYNANNIFLSKNTVISWLKRALDILLTVVKKACEIT